MMDSIIGDLASLVAQASAAVLAGDTTVAAPLYEALLAHDGPGGTAEGGGVSAGAVSHHLARLARCVGHLDAAERHLADALARHEAAGDLGGAARVRCELARLLLERGDERGRFAALRHLDAIASFAGEATAPHDEAAGLRPRATRPRATDRGSLHATGDVWTLAFAGRTCHLRDAKGLHCLAVLLRSPGREFDAAMLEHAATPDGPAQGAAAAQDRTAAERSRLRVTRAIRATLARIEARHPALGRHLASTIRTGIRCVYLPDPRLPVEWTG